MASMEEALKKYIRIHGQGGGQPMTDVGEEGVRHGGYNLSGGVEARIPIDMLMKDALLGLEAGGYTYGGKVELPPHIQAYGEPAEFEYGDSAINNVGLKYLTDGFSAGVNYNPQTNDKSINARLKYKF
jgi:hypothetical protein|tara:strand:+ start:1250 stop:1633 length:384 start_codon:yes stop_codon:yes gene_type:complete